LWGDWDASQCQAASAAKIGVVITDFVASLTRVHPHCARVTFSASTTRNSAIMDTHIADDKLKELHVEDRTVLANDRKAPAFEIDPVAEKKLLRKLDMRVVPVLWLL